MWGTIILSATTVALAYYSYQLKRDLEATQLLGRIFAQKAVDLQEELTGEKVRYMKVDVSTRTLSMTSSLADVVPTVEPDSSLKH